MRTTEDWLEIANNAIEAAINANSLNNIKQNEMKRDEIVEKIKGVKQVTYNDDNAVVSFQPEKSRVVRVTNQEQWDFITYKNCYEWGDWYDGFKESCRKVEHVWLSHMDRSCSDTVLKDELVCDFSDYLEEYNLKEEWEKYLIGEAEKRYSAGDMVDQKTAYNGSAVKHKIGRIPAKCDYMSGFLNISIGGVGVYNVKDCKWAEIVKEAELVEGEIYFVKYKGSDNRVVRYLGMDGTRCVFFYSQYSKQFGLLCGTCADSDYSGSLALHGNELKPATKKQKKKLIKAEIKNGFFFELEKNN